MPPSSLAMRLLQRVAVPCTPKPFSLTCHQHLWPCDYFQGWHFLARPHPSPIHAAIISGCEHTSKGGIPWHAHTLLPLMLPSSLAMSKFPRVPSTVTPSPSHNIAPLQSPFPADAAFFSCHEPTFQGWRQHCPYPFMLMPPSSLAMSQTSKGGVNIAHTLSRSCRLLLWP